MGKKAQMKRIRRIAESLPELKVVQVKGEKVYGHELLERGVEKDAVDKKINPKTMYRNKTSIETPMNHNRNLKRMYYGHGKGGIDTYVNAVKEHVAEQAAKAAAEQDTEAETENPPS